VDASALRADEGRGIAAISVGEPRAGTDPTISEWGNPITLCDDRIYAMRRAPGELKHLSTPRNRHYPRSSGERTGASPNRTGVKPAGLASTGLEDQAGRAAARHCSSFRYPKTSGKRRHSA